MSRRRRGGRRSVRDGNSPALFIPALLAFVVLLACGHRALSDGAGPSVANGVLCFVLSLLLGLYLLIGVWEELG